MRELSGVMEMFYIMIVVVATQLYTLVKTHQTVHVKLVDFILYKLYSSQQKNKYVLLHQTKIPNGSRTETSIARWQTAGLWSRTVGVQILAPRLALWLWTCYLISLCLSSFI